MRLHTTVCKLFVEGFLILAQWGSILLNGIQYTIQNVKNFFMILDFEINILIFLRQNKPEVFVNLL